VPARRWRRAVSVRSAVGRLGVAFRYRLGDKPQTATIGRLDRVTLPEARAKAQEVRALVSDGRHVTAVHRIERARRAASDTATFGGLAAEWLKREARRAKWTDDYRHEVKASLDNHLSALAALPVAEITTAIAAKPMRKVGGDEGDVMYALRAISEARGGIASVATVTGLSRETLYRTLSRNGNPRLSTLLALLRASGMRLRVERAGS